VYWLSKTIHRLGRLFTKYHFRMIPVVDIQDHILEVIQHKDIMQGLVARTKTRGEACRGSR